MICYMCPRSFRTLASLFKDWQNNLLSIWALEVFKDQTAALIALHTVGFA